MPTTVFSAPALEFSVVQGADGSLKPHGLYRGQNVKTALPIEHGAKCVLLLDGDARLTGSFENLFCIDRDGNVAWIAPLPTSHDDTFVEISLGNDGLRAHSWSCYRLVLDPQSGKVLSEEFTK